MRPCFVGFSVEVGHGLVGGFDGLAVGVIDALAVGLDQIAFSIPAPDGSGRVDELSIDRAVFIEQSTRCEVCARLSCGVLAEEAEYILLDHATTLCVRREFHFKDNGCVIAGSQVRDGARQDRNPIDFGGRLIGVLTIGDTQIVEAVQPFNHMG